MNTVSSIVMGEEIRERYIRLESGDSDDVRHVENRKAVSRTNGAEDTRQPVASPSPSLEEIERELREENFDLYRLLKLGDEGPIS